MKVETNGLTGIALNNQAIAHRKTNDTEGEKKWDMAFSFFGASATKEDEVQQNTGGICMYVRLSIP